MNGTTITKLLSATVILTMLVAFAAPAAAQEEEFFYKRQIGEAYTTETAYIVSAAITPQGSDWVIFALNTVGDDDKGLGLGVLYGHGSDAGENQWATGSFIAPFGIVEYRDDGDGRYDLRGDDVVSLLPLHADLENHDGFYDYSGESDETMTWYERPGYKPVTHTNVLGLAGAEAITLGAETNDGVFTIVMHISNSVIFNESVQLSPYEVKIDFIIEGYPYVEEDTELALLQIIATGNAKWHDGLPEEYTEAYQSSDEEGGWAFDIEGGAGYFSWLRTANVDGVDQEVRESTLMQFSEFNWTQEKTTRIDLKYVAFAYGRGDTIIHDPKLGFVFEGGLPPVFEKLIRGNGGLFLISIVMFAGVIHAARWSRRRSAAPKRVEVSGGTPPSSTPPPSSPPSPPAQPMTSHVPPRAPPQTPPQGGTPPSPPPGSPPGGARSGQPEAPVDPRYGYRPPGQ